MALTSLLTNIQFYRFSILSLCFLVLMYWLFLLWRKTGDGAFVWMMAGIGFLPFLTTAGVIVQLVIELQGSQTGPVVPATIALLGFLFVTTKVMAFGFIVMGLRQIAGGCVGVRALFSFRASNSIGEGEA